MPDQLTRPASFEAYLELMEARRAKSAGASRPETVFVPDPTDVIISPYGKCGTTWLQQIVHTLRTRGDTDFDDISRVVPWIETSDTLGLDLDAPQRGAFRAYKSHLGYDTIPKGARYIVSFRDPRDAVVSLFRFTEGWFFEVGSVDVNAFARHRYLEGEPGRSYWSHLLSWWEQRDSESVLLLAYEQMVRDPVQAIRHVASFTGVELDEALLDLTRQRSSLDYMLRNKHQFDDKLMRDHTERTLGFPSGSDSAKVRQGTVGSHRQELGDDVVQALDARWTQEVTPVTGLSTYQDLLQQLGN